MALTPNDDLVVILLPVTALLGALAQTHPDPDAVRVIYDDRTARLLSMLERSLSSQHATDLRGRIQEVRQLIGPQPNSAGSN